MKKFVLIAVLVLSGCGMHPMNDEGLFIIRTKAEESHDAVVDGLKATKGLVDELQDAAQEERAPDLAPHITNIVNSLDTASKAINETGKTATVMQNSMGTPKSAPPTDKVSLEVWRRKYAVLGQLMDAALNWLSKAAPGVPIPTKQKPEPWSTGETAGLVGTIVAALAGGGAGGKKLWDRKKQQRAEKDEAEASAAEADRLVEQMRAKLGADEFNEVMRENKRLQARLDRHDYDKKANGNG